MELTCSYVALGFVGSLTTVSTWFNELQQLYHAPTASLPVAPALAALRYALVTIILAIFCTQLLRLG
jgi:fluoride ion exporter CrcB/FEX